MVASIAQSIVLVFGILVGVMCLWGIASPERLITAIRSLWDKDLGMTLAVAVRALLGLALLGAAAASRLTTLFYILGAISLVAAAVIPLLGRGRIDQLIARFESVSNVLIRVWLAFGIGFAALLIYGAV